MPTIDTMTAPTAVRPKHSPEPVTPITENDHPAGFAHLEGYVEDARTRTLAAERFDLSPVLARYQREHGFSDAVVADHRRELVRFLALSATSINRQRFYGMMGAIDELWHTFVIFTQDYARFCDQVAGQFLHHVPEADGRASQGTIDHYVAFLADYEAVYGEAAPVAYWPRPHIHAFAGTSGEACSGCRGCNACTGQSCTVH